MASTIRERESGATARRSTRRNTGSAKLTSSRDSGEENSKISPPWYSRLKPAFRRSKRRVLSASERAGVSAVLPVDFFVFGREAFSGLCGGVVAGLFRGDKNRQFSPPPLGRN